MIIFMHQAFFGRRSLPLSLVFLIALFWSTNHSERKTLAEKIKKFHIHSKI